MTTAAMDQTGTAPPLGGGHQSDTPADIIHTRFGMVPATKDQQVVFKGGLPGFPGKECFQLERIPEVQGDIYLLQSVDSAEVAFFVLRLDSSNEILKAEDISATCKQLDIPEDQLLMLGVVKLQRTGDKIEKYINMRAPIFIDMEKQHGVQIVLNNADYPIRLPLNS